ncbi:MAG TPA: phasin [Aestuariivirgaceae bacterium]|nr:phasin [Aestuariivirgaceae bacterium]
MTDIHTKKPGKAGTTPNFELPKFDIPKFDMPKIEMPEAFRDMAEKGVQQAKDTYARMKSAAEEATDLAEDTYATATKGAAEFNLKALEAMRINMNAAFDYSREFLGAKTAAEAVELSTTHLRKQFETLAAQTKYLSALAQKVATETAEPIKAGVSKNFKVN